MAMTAIIKPDGEAIVSCSDDEKIMYATISKSDLIKFRERFQFYKDADDFTLPMG